MTQIAIKVLGFNDIYASCAHNNVVHIKAFSRNIMEYISRIAA